MSSPATPDQLTADLERASKGDRMAFRRLVDAHYEYAYRLAFRTLRSVEESEEIVQETFIRIWEHLPTFDTSRKFTTWMYTIVSNLCIDTLRKQKRRGTWFSTEENESEHVADSADTVHHEESRDLTEIVRVLTKRLSPTQRLVFALRDLEDLDVAEVVTITGLSTGSVKTNLSFARKKIREFLIREYGVEEAHP